MVRKVMSFLWGDLTTAEYKKFGILALVYMMIIGCYALIDSLKYTLFLKMVGKVYLPYAKIVSLCLIFPMILVYSKLVDMYSKEKLFYFFSAFYIAVFLLFNFLLSLPNIGISNTDASPLRILGWAFFVIVESYTSFVISLFLSIVVSSTSMDSAKKGFALVAAGAQLGAFLGPSVVAYASYFGMLNLLKMACGTIFVSAGLIKLFMNVCEPDIDTKHEAETQKKAGILEGLKLLLSQPYVFVIFLTTALYSIVGTVIDYQLKYTADGVFHNPEKLLEFFGFYGQCTNIVSFAFALLGTSYLLRRLGLKFCLVIFPVLTMFILSFILVDQSFWAIFWGALVFRALSYGFNNPNREMLYIPTSKAVKFKAKSWIDVFGIRLSKATGSGFNAFFVSANLLLVGGSAAAMVITLMWIPLSVWLANKNKQLIKENKIIE